MKFSALKNIVKDQNLMIDFISDPGHGWIKIPKKLSNGLKFSSCSYQDPDNYYLEEDQDACLFLDKLKDHKIKYSFNEIILNESCFIRDLMRLKN